MGERTEYMKAWSAKRRQSPEYRARQREWNREWRERNGRTTERLARKAAQMRAYRNDPELRVRHEARELVNKAIQAGDLAKQPCEVCGAIKVDGHHDDYAKPLEVRWLCRAHHQEHHAKATSDPLEPAKPVEFVHLGIGGDVA